VTDLTWFQKLGLFILLIAIVLWFVQIIYAPARLSLDGRRRKKFVCCEGSMIHQPIIGSATEQHR
jgi:hypothetical protein